MKILLILLALCTSVAAWSQEARLKVLEGNQQYEAGNFEEAQARYDEAIKVDPNSFPGRFNRADALYRQQKFAEAAQQFQSIASEAEDAETRANAYHNLGNSQLQAEEYEKAINAYKNALRANPKDEDTRYNLAYAQQKLKQQQQQQQNQDQNEENKDEENKDEQNQDQQDKKDQEGDKENQEQQDNKEKNEDGKNEEQKNQEGEENENQEKKDQEGQQQKDGQEGEEKQQPRPHEISPEDAERLLDALNREEQKVQARLKRKKKPGQKITIEKDW